MHFVIPNPEKISLCPSWVCTWKVGAAVTHMYSTCTKRVNTGHKSTTETLLLVADYEINKWIKLLMSKVMRAQLTGLAVVAAGLANSYVCIAVSVTLSELLHLWKW